MLLTAMTKLIFVQMKIKDLLCDDANGKRFGSSKSSFNLPGKYSSTHIAKYSLAISCKCVWRSIEK